LQSKPQWAAAMLQAIAHEGLLPCKYVVADGLSGQSPALLDAVDAWVGSTTCVALPSETRGWLQRPGTEGQSYTSKGAGRAKRGVVAAATPPGTVAAVAASLPASPWYRRTGAEGTQGPIAYAFARPRVTLCQEGLPGRTVWLVIQRTLGATPVDASSMSTAPVSTPWRTFVWLRGLRWALAQCFADGQTERGRAPDAVRQSPGWHHHRLTTMLAHCLLWHLKLRLGKTSASPHCVAAADVMGGRRTLADVYSCRRAGVHRVGAAASPHRVSRASDAATRGRMRLARDVVCY
jgi:hypothetical protein